MSTLSADAASAKDRSERLTWISRLGKILRRGQQARAQPVPPPRGTKQTMLPRRERSLRRNPFFYLLVAVPAVMVLMVTGQAISQAASAAPHPATGRAASETSRQAAGEHPDLFPYN
jgi:hypothetical protein